MADPTADTVAGPSPATGLASLLDALARFQSAALLYPPTHRRIAESSGALVAALQTASDLRGEVRLALSDGRLLRDGAVVTDLASPAKKLVADWDALGVARIAFLPHLVPDDLVAFARFLKEATTQIGGGHRPTLASFELVPRSIDIVSRDYGRPHRAEESLSGDALEPTEAGGGGSGTGGGTGEGTGRGRQRPLARPIDDEELALREATGARDASVPEVATEALAKLLRIDEEAAPAVEALETDDRVATLARILHLLARVTPASPGRTALEGRLAELVAQKCGDLEQGALLRGLTGFVQGGRAQELSSTLDAVGPALRIGGSERAADLLLTLLDRQAQPQSSPPPPPPQIAATRRVLWVHLAQEILLSLGVQGDAIERRAGRLLAQLEGEEYDAAVPELAALPAIREKTFVKGTLAPMRRELYGLYRALLRVGGAIAEELATNFAQRPPATAAAGAFFALRDDNQGARAFLERFLTAQRVGKEDAELLSSAGTILRSYLETLAPARRGEPWVASAVAALKRLSSPETDATLARIRRERRMLVLHGWPKACRDAAAGGAAR